ncbi:hypothetical protein IT575_13095 [bacterium]|nr:hypothetical protein [bacterium]
MGGKMSQAASVGLIVAMAVVMAVVSIALIRSEFFFRGKTYYVLVHFENGIGIKEGMSVKMAGSDVGWVEKTGYREDLGLTESKVRIYERIPLYKVDVFITGQESMLGERVMMIQEGGKDRSLHQRVKEGDVMLGEAQGDFTQLMAGAAKTVDSVNELLSEDKLGGDLHSLIMSMNGSMAQANLMMASMQETLSSSQGDINGTLKNFKAMSANFLSMSQNFNTASSAITDMASDPANRETAEQLRNNLAAISEQMRILTEQMSSLASDPLVQQDMKDSARLARETMENMQSVSGRFNATLDKVDGLLDSSNVMVKDMNKVVNGAGGLISTVGGTLDGFSSAGDSIDVNLNADLRALDIENDKNLDEDDDYLGDINATVGFGKNYFQLGADNIGEGDDWNFLMGFGGMRGASWRTGVYRSELGLGLRYGFGKQGDVTTMLYDTHDPKLNAIGRIPVGDSVNVIVGAEDVTDDAKGTVGVGVEF